MQEVIKRLEYSIRVIDQVQLADMHYISFAIWNHADASSEQESAPWIEFYTTCSNDKQTQVQNLLQMIDSFWDSVDKLGNIEIDFGTKVWMLIRVMEVNNEKMRDIYGQR